MRFLLSAGLLLFFTSLIFAQSNGKFGLSVGATYNYRTVSPDRDILKELPAVHYHLGIAYLQPLGKNIGLLGGLGFRTIGYNSEKTELRWGIEFGGPDIVDPSLPQELQFFNQHRFLEVPIGLRFQVVNRAHLYWQIGINNLVYLNTRTRTETNLSTSTEVNRNDFIRNAHTVLQLEMGWQWPMGDSPFLLSLAPSLQFHLTALNKEEDSKEYPYSGGLSVGFWW
jgi:hypothetical protein